MDVVLVVAVLGDVVVVVVLVVMVVDLVVDDEAFTRELHSVFSNPGWMDFI